MQGQANVSPLFDSPLEDAIRREPLYSGDIFISSASPSTVELMDLGRSMLGRAFAPHDLRDIHRHATLSEVATVLSQLKPRFFHHDECKRLIPLIMAEHMPESVIALYNNGTEVQSKARYFSDRLSREQQGAGSRW